MTLFPGRILLATDGSEGADLAARKAADVAEATGSELHLVYVEPLPEFMKRGPAPWSTTVNSTGGSRQR